MPKRKQRRARKNPRGAGNVVREAFQTYLTTALSSGLAQVSVHPSNFSQLAACAAVYELYRFTKLEYELLPRNSGNSTVTCAYYPDATVTSVATVTNMENLDAIIIKGAGMQTTPVRHHVPAVRLRGQISWWKCVPDAASAEFENQGVLAFSGTTTETVDTIVRGVCEFKNPMDSGAALSSLRIKARQEVLDELRSAVAPTSVSQTSPTVPKELASLAQKFGLRLSVSPTSDPALGSILAFEKM